MLRRLCLVAILIAGWSCAAKRPDPAREHARQEAKARAHAEAQVLQGCYDCLLDARAAYERLTATRAQSADTLRLFEVLLLLTLREKELALDWTGTLARARALAVSVSPSVNAERLLAVVDAVPPDDLGVPQVEDSAFRRSRGAYLPTIDGELDWLAAASEVDPRVRQYLSLAIDCAFLRRARRSEAREPLARRLLESDDTPPLLLYRVGICDVIRPMPLDAARAVEPRFAEAAYFLARRQAGLAQETGAPGARPLLAEAYARFPTSPSVTYLNGNFLQLLGNCAAALAFYDATIALKPVHENALLGRTICLTFLTRLEEAIAAATHMIELQTPNMSEAYYWRAWIRHHQKQLALARADIESAKAIASSNAIHRLAGMIEHDQDDLAAADKDLEAAKTMLGGGSDCVSRWYLGLVEMKRERWKESAAHFEEAMDCYERSAALAEGKLAAMASAENLDPEFKARQIAGFQAAITADRSQQYASAFNAANHHARGGNVARAKVLVEVAARDPALDKLTSELRRLLGGGTGT